MEYLIDTNVISEIRKGLRADAGVRSWFGHVHDADLFVSVLTLGEIRKGSCPKLSLRTGRKRICLA